MGPRVDVQLQGPPPGVRRPRAAADLQRQGRQSRPAGPRPRGRLMDLRETAADREFRGVVRAWLADNLTGEFAAARGLGGPGREEEAFDLRWAWERHLGAAG